MKDCIIWLCGFFKPKKLLKECLFQNCSLRQKNCKSLVITLNKDTESLMRNYKLNKNKVNDKPMHLGQAITSIPNDNKNSVNGSDVFNFMGAVYREIS